MTPINPQTHIETRRTSQEIFQGNILRIRLDEVVLPHGGIRQREVVEHPGGVVVGAILSNGKFLLIQQFRYALGQFLYEFPAGKLDPGEVPLVAIQRELEEETGYKAEHWTEITHIYTSPGFCDEKITIFKATGLALSETPRREEDEFIAVLEASHEELREMIAQKTLIDAKTICALALIAPEVLS